MVRETWVQSQVESYQKTLKMVFDTSLLNTQQYRYVSSVKWSNPGKGVAPSPIPRYSSYWKWSLLVAFDYRETTSLLVYPPFRTRWNEFNDWTNLFELHLTQMHFGKIWTHHFTFSYELLIDITGVFNFSWTTNLEEEKLGI